MDPGNYANSDQEDAVTSARMRMLGKLRVRLQTIVQKANCHLDSFINGEGFDKSIDAIKVEGEAYADDSGRWGYKIPG